jgi:uncharacterized protein YcbX
MRVTQLWRFPVKSMGGGEVEAVRIDRRGVHADRLWAVRDVAKGVTVSARRVPVLLGCSARYAAEPGNDAGPGNAPRVIVTFPDGRELASDDPAVNGALSDLVGREMRLVALAPAADTSQHRMSMQESMANFSASQVRKDLNLSDSDDLPDTTMFTTRQIMTLARYTTPPGTFVDLSPVHVLSTASLKSLSAHGEPYDVRRFRPNVLVDVGEQAQFPETAWVGGEVGLGAVKLRVTNPTIRCVVPTRPQPGIELDKELSRQLAARTNRFLGVYADVVMPGVVRVGDDVRTHLPHPPSALKRATSAASKSATRGVQRILEATVLREKG